MHIVMQGDEGPEFEAMIFEIMDYVMGRVSSERGAEAVERLEFPVKKAVFSAIIELEAFGLNHGGNNPGGDWDELFKRFLREAGANSLEDYILGKLER